MSAPVLLGVYVIVTGFLAKAGNPVDRLGCGHVVRCTRLGATDPHTERCAECSK